MNRRIAAILLAAVVLVAVGTLVVITVWSPLRTPEVSGPEAVPPGASGAGEAREAPDPALQRFYDQELDWEACDDNNHCARLEVPLDYGDPGGRVIELAVLRRDADLPSGRVGSLIVNPGGPGAEGTSYADDAALHFRPALVQRFDVVGFDPRGVGASAAIDCATDAQLDEWIASDAVPDDARQLAEFREQLTAFGTGCAARSGALVRHVSTIEAARDMDVLRAALDEDLMLYFGASYGTKLGATYAQLFPQRVGRLVLDGAIDLTISSQEATLAQARGFQVALDAYLEDCLESAPCFLGDDLDSAGQRIADLLADLDEDPLVVGDRELTSGNAFYGIVAPLYSKQSWGMLTNALKAALDGDGSMLLTLSDAYTRRSLTGEYSSNIMEANIAINCLDDPGAATPREVRESLPAFREASPVFGELFAWSTVGCTGFPGRTDERVEDPSAAGADPILVIGTTRDPATPYEWAEALSSQLESGVLVSRDGDGHLGYNSGNSCVDDAVEAYLIAGTVPEDGLSC